MKRMKQREKKQKKQQWEQQRWEWRVLRVLSQRDGEGESTPQWRRTWERASWILLLLLLFLLG